MAPGGRAAARRWLAAAGAAVLLAGCTVAHRTDLFRQDTLSASQKDIAETKINWGDMTIEGTVDRADTTYDPGQPITLSVKVSKDAHVAILRVLASGDTTIVFPNRKHPKADVAANTVLTVPAPDDAVSITVDKPQIVLFEFIASTSGTSWLFKRPPDDGSDFADLGVTTRTIAHDLVGTLKVGGGPETVAKYLTVRIGKDLF